MREDAVELAGGSLFVYEWGSQDDPAVLYWDGLGGSGLHANEIAPVLAEEYGLRVIAPDPPGHGRSPALPAESYRPSRLAEIAARLLDELGVARAAFVGFSWGGSVAMSFAALMPERTTALVLVDGGYYVGRPLAGNAAADFAACLAEAQLEREEDSFESWEAYFACQRESLKRWTPALKVSHRAIMSEEDGRVVPILEAEVLAAIKHGGRLEPVTEIYPLIADAGPPVMLLTTPTGDSQREAVSRLLCALPDARVEWLPGGIHDLVSHSPHEIAHLAGAFVTAAR